MNGWAAGICVAALLLFSQEAMAAASRAAEVFVKGVMPALFPMMVVGKLMRLPQKNEHSFPGAVVMAFAGGSPASAQRVRILYDAGRVPRGALEPLLAATGVMSPMFFVGTLVGWTGLRGACWAMLAAHWLGALVAAGLWALARRLWKGGQTQAGRTDTEGRRQPGASRPASAPDRREALGALLPRAITEAAQALLAVCGSMMLFSILAGVLRAALLRLCPVWTAANEPALSVLWALLETGSGAAAVLKSHETPPLMLLCGLCSFGGLSIWLQNLLFVGECVRPAKLLQMRALHGAVSMGLFAVFERLWPALTAAFAAPGAEMVRQAGVPALVPLLLSGLALYRRRAS